MIAGPILPRHADSLWHLVREDPDRIEHGLRLVRGELVLESGVVVDAIAADAVGRVVLVFAGSLEEDQALPGRVAESRAWFQRNARMMASALAADNVDLNVPCRVLVLGFDFTATCLDRLRDLGDEGLTVLRVEGFRLEGELHVGVQPVLVTDHHAAESDPFRVPAALSNGSDSESLERFLGLLRRLDPELRSTGDRYSRQWHTAGGTIVELTRVGSEIRVRVPGSSDAPLGGVDDVSRSFDPILRRYLALQDADDSAADAVLAEEAMVIDDRPAAPQAQARFGDTSITSEEYDAFLEQDG